MSSAPQSENAQITILCLASYYKGAEFIQEVPVGGAAAPCCSPPPA